jgi:hypothetical protein
VDHFELVDRCAPEVDRYALVADRYAVVDHSVVVDHFAVVDHSVVGDHFAVEGQNEEVLRSAAPAQIAVPTLNATDAQTRECVPVVPELHSAVRNAQSASHVSNRPDVPLPPDVQTHEFC